MSSSGESARPTAPAASVVVIAGGTAPSTEEFEAVRRRLPGCCQVVVADSGADHAHVLGIDVDVAVGDFESAPAAAQAWLHRSGAEILSFPQKKDRSDLELALEVAVDRASERIAVLGLGGGRPDHALLNLVLLADRRWEPVSVIGVADGCLVTVVRGEVDLRDELGGLVTLIPVGGAGSVSTVGLLYPLDGDELSPTATRGLSNVFAASEAVVRAEQGVVLAMQPGRGWLAS